MSRAGDFGNEVPSAADRLRGRLGAPDLGVVLGSGVAPLAEALGAGVSPATVEVPGRPPCSVDGHAGGVASVRLSGANVWLFLGRLHLYEGCDPATAVLPVALLAAAGAPSVLLTCAAGGLLDSDRPGDFALVADHLNLTGADPIRSIPPGTREPAFLDLHDAYDPAFRRSWRRTAGETGAALREGILAAMHGPSYETPAEVRMLRALGADLVSMSTVPETIAARYLGMRVAAVACVANRGAGLAGSGAIEHGGVVDRVRAAVAGARNFLSRGIEGMIGSEA